MTQDVLIVGTGLAGLCCARRLREAGLRPPILETSDDAGGRICTEIGEEFRLDQNFQVFLTSYAEAQRVLDYPALTLGLRAAEAVLEELR